MPENLVIKQHSFYKSEDCQKAIQAVEDKYRFMDESANYSNLVNFSTSKTEPYQRWVRYREGYSTILVDSLISASGVDPTTHYIADPMVGSGSTIIAAKRLGFDSFGVDINPYCKLIIDAKIEKPTDDDFSVIRQFLSSLPEHYAVEDGQKPPLSEYFPDGNLTDLLGLRQSIGCIKEDVPNKILNACWFFILEACSNRKKDGNGLATRPAPVDNVIKHYKETVDDILTDYMEHPFDQAGLSSVYIGSATDFFKYSKRFEEESQKKLGAIIFSPPYANAFDYYESYKMELLFGQLYSMEDYQVHKKEQVRNYRISYGKKIDCDIPIVEMLCKEIDEAIPIKEKALGKRDARTRLMPNMLRGYFTDMSKVLAQLYKALDSNGKCYIVVDQSAYVGVIVPTDILLADLAEKNGFSVDAIKICRKASTSGQQRKAYPYLGTTLRESIVCLSK